MTNRKFEQPVSVFVGLGFPREVGTVLDAYDLLLEWPGISDLDHHGVLEVCRKALIGERTAEDVREAFIHFARCRGMLSQEALDQAAQDFAREWGQIGA